MPLSVFICAGFTISWTIGSLAWLGIDDGSVALMEQTWGVPITPDTVDEFAAALAMDFRRGPVSGFGPSFPRNVPGSNGTYWRNIDLGQDLGCAESWDPFPTRAESLIALQRYALFTATVSDPVLNFGLANTGFLYDLAAEVGTDVPLPGSITQLIEHALLLMSKEYRFKSGVWLDHAQPGKVRYSPDGPRTWAETARWYG